MPDLRTAGLPASVRLAAVAHASRLEADELARLAAFAPEFTRLCAELATRRHRRDRATRRPAPPQRVPRAARPARARLGRHVDRAPVLLGGRDVPVPRGAERARAGRPVVPTDPRRVPRAVGPRSGRGVRARAAGRDLRPRHRVGRLPGRADAGPSRTSSTSTTRWSCAARSPASTSERGAIRRRLPIARPRPSSSWRATPPGSAPGVRRPLALIGALLVVAGGMLSNRRRGSRPTPTCSSSSTARAGPRSRSKRTISASCAPIAEPRGGPTTTTAVPRAPTPEEIAAVNDALVGQDGGAPVGHHDRRCTTAVWPSPPSAAPSRQMPSSPTCAARPIGSWARSGSPTPMRRPLRARDPRPLARCPPPRRPVARRHGVGGRLHPRDPRTLAAHARRLRPAAGLRGLGPRPPSCHRRRPGPGCAHLLDVLAGDRARGRRVDARRARRRAGPLRPPGLVRTARRRCGHRCARRERRARPRRATRRTISTTPSPPRWNVRSTTMPGRSSPSACCWRWREPPASVGSPATRTASAALGASARWTRRVRRRTGPCGARRCRRAPGPGRRPGSPRAGSR